MTKANDLASLLDANGDVVSSALDNVPASDLVNDTTPQLGGNLDTNGNDINFGDNNKAIFGAGSDLQIYHDGSASIVYDNGTGPLNLQTNNSNINIKGGGSASHTMGIFKSTEGVDLYYNNVKKFETTATGVDVTGGLNTTDFDVIPTNSANYYPQIGGGVDGGADAYLALSGGTSGNGNLAIKARGTYGSIKFYTGGSSGSASTTERLRIDGSTGNVGIGTVPESFAKLEVKTSTDKNIAIFDNAAGPTIGAITDAGSSQALRLAGQTIIMTGAGGSGAEHMRIDSSGNVGIGTSAPSGAKLEIFTGSTTTDGLKISRYTPGNYYSTLRQDSHGLAIHVGVGGTVSERVAITPNGLTFNGDTAAANALDDYEEGAYNVTFSGTSGTPIVHSGAGYYIKIGRMVYIRFYAYGGSNPTVPSGSCYASLPFTADTSNAPYTPILGAYSGGLTFSAASVSTSQRWQINDSVKLTAYIGNWQTNPPYYELSGAGCYIATS